jgi:hypothetical protein
MNTLAITEAAAATLAGTLPFPKIVAKLIAAAVEYHPRSCRCPSKTRDLLPSVAETL